MEDESTEQTPNSRAPLLVALALASILGAVSFVFMFSGFGGLPSDAPEQVDAQALKEVQSSNPIFIPIEPLVISLGSAGNGKSLRFEGYLEISSGKESEITALMPRITDSLNTYLRAIEFSDIEEPTSLLRIRLQMLKRVQIIVGEDKVRDLLVSKFLIG